MCNTIVEGYQPPAQPARQPLPMTALTVKIRLDI